MSDHLTSLPIPDVEYGELAHFVIGQTSWRRPATWLPGVSERHDRF